MCIRDSQGNAGYEGLTFEAPAYLLLLSEVKPGYLENAGYMNEDMILHMTDLGRDSCWLTVDDDPALRAALKIGDGKKVASVSYTHLDRMSRLDKDLFRLQSQKEKLEERLENSANYMWDEYELTYSAALELKGGEEESLPEIRKHIASLKEEIKKLGNVNVNAIEDYKEVSERYVFMKTQHDDLVTAEETLLKTIEMCIRDRS